MSDHLSPPNTKHWVIGRRGAVVTAVRRGHVILEKALRYWQLTDEQYRS
jgi:hypothetical protein